MSVASLEQARAVQPKLEAMLEGVEGVSGIGLTLVGDGYGLRVNLETSLAMAAVPPELDGVPIVVEIVGEIRPL